MDTKPTNFTVNQEDLVFILKQIVVAEREVAGETLQQIIGPNAAILPMGLRHVDGSNNNLLPGGERFGAADTVLPRLTDPVFGNDADGDQQAFGPPGSGAPILTNTDYGVPGDVADADPRTISNLIVDMSNNNPAAIAAWYANPLAVGAYEDAHNGNPPPPGYIPSNEELSRIPNQSPDIGLSPSFNGWFTLFGQFFDHGLDLITKGGNGTVYIPLQPDDPLYVEGGPNFMALSRSTPALNPATGLLTETVNTTTGWVDQNQTYTSHPSHQVFLREYEFSVDSDNDGVKDSFAVSTGRLLDGATGGIANWAETKAQALTMLGIKLTDADVLNVPLLRTDAYGEFVRGANGYAQIATPNGFVEGTAEGIEIPADAYRTGHSFLNDIAHHAVPVFDDDHNPATPDIARTPDADPGVTDDGIDSTYDDEMLNAHFVTGDGRGNENIGLTAVHTIFHSEHNRLVADNKATILASGDIAFINEWLLDDISVLPADTGTLVWDGERLFQAAKFVTEMQYQHLVFEEFARKVQPLVDPFVFTNTPDIDPSIVAEFAHVVYRFGHSMLTDTIDRTDINMNKDDIQLFDAFLNPQAFTASGLDAATAAGAIIRGMANQTGNEIDEFVASSLRNTLLGLPLDLPALNIARGREAGVAAFNVVRADFFEKTGNVDLKPYDSWLAYAQNLKNPLSIVNFIAAYGTHDSITSEETLAGKRAAAELLVLGGAGAPADRIDFLNHSDSWANQETGLNLVDLWIGGLAEKKTEFGGMLGSTFNFVFEVQMEKLQNGDRLYYLSRLQGTNLLNQLEPNTFAELAMRNTDLGQVGSSHVAGALFDTPDLTLELNQSVQVGDDPTQDSAILEAIDPKVTRIDPGADVDGDGKGDGGFLRFAGGEHVVLGGTEGNDTLIGDRGIDTLWGDSGDDYLNAGTESDQVFGGDGDDIIVDPFGDNFLRGEGGNDVITSGAGLNLLFGGSEQDFIVLGADGGEVFAGSDNDFILGGTGADAILGNDGDDWMEGGEGFDTLSGENSELFFNSPIIGHDVMNGQGNDTDYDGENGDDIMVQGPGIQRNNGMDGFDWAIHKGDPNGADSDLGIRIFVTRPDLILRDRFDSVEGLSGWNQDDILTGAAKLLAGGFNNSLTQAGVDRIDGLRVLLNTPTGAPTDVVSNPQLGEEIIIGGDGDDAISGNLGDDFLDGDAWLNVRISVRENKDGTGAELFSVDSMNDIKARMMTREINPGQLQIVREIVVADGSDDVDTAIFSDLSDNYDITANDNGTYTVAHTRGTGIDGVDTLRNIETLQFADIFVDLAPINSAAVGAVLIDNTTPARNQTLTASKAFYDANGINASTLVYTWQALSAPDTWTDVATGETFQPGNAEVGKMLRVVASFNDYQGNAESITSEATAAVTQIDAPAQGAVIINGNATEKETLTADTSGITDANGLGAFSYQWMRAGVDIADATGVDYTLRNADVDQQISVRVNFTDGLGVEETLTSIPTASVANVNDAPEGVVVINGEALENATLSADASGIIDRDGLGSFSYQWQRGGIDISGATDVDYVLKQADVGQNISVTVSYTDAHGTAESVDSTTTDPIVNANNAPQGAVTITGTLKEGETLTANSTITDVDGISAGAFNYQWLTEGLPIAGANQDTYTLVDGDAGAHISVVVSYTDNQGGLETVISASTDPIADANPPPPNSDPIGTATAVLAAGIEDTDYLVSAADLLQGYTDADGDTLSVADLAASNGTVLDNGNGSFTITPAANFNGAVSLTYNVTDGKGGSAAATQSFNLAAANDAPTGTVLIDDTTPDVNQLLNATNSIADVDGLGALSYQWQTSSNGTTWTNIGGATAASFTTGAAQAGLQLRVQASYVDAGGTSESVNSAATAAVPIGGGDPPPPPPPVGNTINGNNASNTLNGTAGVDIINGLGGNDTLNGQGGNDFLDGGSGNDLLNGGIGDDTMLGGIGNDLYKVNSTGDIVIENADEGTDRVDSSVSYTLGDNVENLSLFNGGSYSGTGNALNNVIVGNSSANTLIGGAGDDTLTGNAGNDNIQGGDGTDTAVFSGAKANYNISDVLPDGTRTVAAISGNNGIDTISGIEKLQFSDQTFVLDSAAPGSNNAPTGNVVISGTATENQVLTANTDGVNDADGLGAFSYQWRRNGSNIATAVAASYTLVDADVGAQISVSISYIDQLGTAETLTSANTAAVANVNDAPTGSVTIDDTTPGIGQTLNAADTLADDDGLGAIGYQWQTSGNGIDWTDLAGATAAAFTTTPDQDGLQLRVQASYTDGGGTSESVTSEATAAVAGVAPPPPAGNVINGTNASQIINGTANADIINGLSGGDTLNGLDGDDTLDGGPGNDLLNGGPGNDIMLGGSGNDIYKVHSSGDVVIENANEGIDRVDSALSYTLGDNIENLTLLDGGQFTGTGNALNNVITGNSSANNLFGGDGDDTLTGGLGSAGDVMTGGIGNDTFKFNAASQSPVGANCDVVTDFLQGSDLLSFAGIDANTLIAADQAFNFIGNAVFGNTGDLRFSFDGTNTIIEGDVNGDAVADFQVALIGNVNLELTDLVA